MNAENLGVLREKNRYYYSFISSRSLVMRLKNILKKVALYIAWVTTYSRVIQFD